MECVLCVEINCRRGKLALYRLYALQVPFEDIFSTFAPAGPPFWSGRISFKPHKVFLHVTCDLLCRSCGGGAVLCFSF
jgi:hypothetical protein